MEIIDPKWINEIHTGNAPDILGDIPSDSIHFVMFSPPYWSLRDYGGDEVEDIWGGEQDCTHQWGEPIPGDPRGGSGTPNDKHNRGESYGRNSSRGRICKQCGAWQGQLGLEPNAEMYISHIVEFSQEIKRVLRPDGSWWLNIGDTFSNTDFEWCVTKENGEYTVERRNTVHTDKCKTFTPQQTALQLIKKGWILRNDCLWKKTNPMPESVDDRLSTTFEYLFHFVQNDSYHFDLDAIREPYKTLNNDGKTQNGGFIGKNPGDIIELPTDGFTEGHFAVYPPKLVEKPLKATCPPKTCENCGTPYERQIKEIKRPELRDRSTNRTDHNETEWNNNRNSWAGTPKERQTVGWNKNCDCQTDKTEPGIVLDPMCGRGTTCKVATEHGRHYIGIDINPEYVELAEKFVPNSRQQTLTEYQ